WAYRCRPHWQLEGWPETAKADLDYSCYAQCFWHIYHTIRQKADKKTDEVNVRLVEVYLGGLAD
ncbi:MAG TPA: hypothetical protein VG013_19300, partial [Gemmataceae bacterium]|nr:hypothetical protein [Gemmataceae bacterium]